MKKVLCAIVLFVFLMANSSCCALGSKTKLSEKQKIEFTTRDGFILVGDLYLSQKPSNKPLIVCLHSFSMSAIAWQKLAMELRKKDYNVLAMDTRGHGRSIYNSKLKVKSRYQFTSEDWQKLPRDVAQSIRYVKSNYANINTEDIIIIGADMGASAGVLASVTLPKTPEKMVLISPISKFKGLAMPVKSHKFYHTKMMYITTKSDRVFLKFYVETDPIIKQYPLGGPGTQLIKVNPEAVLDIVKFIEG